MAVLTGILHSIRQPANVEILVNFPILIIASPRLPFQSHYSFSQLTLETYSSATKILTKTVMFQTIAFYISIIRILSCLNKTSNHSLVLCPKSPLFAENF